MKARAALAAGHGRKERNLVALGDRLRTRCEFVIDGEANGSSRRKLRRKGASAPDQSVDDRSNGEVVLAGQFEPFTAGAKRFPQTGEIDEAYGNDV